MKQLTIDTGVQEFEINGSGVLRFNPSDPNVYNRFFAAETTLTELDAEAQKRMEQMQRITALYEFVARFRRWVSNDPYKCCRGCCVTCPYYKDCEADAQKR